MCVRSHSPTKFGHYKNASLAVDEICLHKQNMQQKKGRIWCTVVIDFGFVGVCISLFCFKDLIFENETLYANSKCQHLTSSK